MVMYVRPSGSPSVSHSFPHYSPTCFDILSWNFTCQFSSYEHSIKAKCHQFPSIFVGVMPLLELKILEIHGFPHFSYTHWHIDQKFCIWLCFTVLQIKFECRQFPSIFVGVMPLLELRILKIHSFPRFSPTCFDILSWNFAYNFNWLYFSSSSSVVNFCRNYAPFWT